MKADAYNSNIGNTELSTSNSTDLAYNTTAISYEQLSRQFYQSYDPSIGLHTAAVLGGILVWLVIYVIYRTKVRKCVLRLIKKNFAEEEELDPKDSDSDVDFCGGVNPTMVRALINPSIVIDESPSQSPLAYEHYAKPGDHDCFSPYSLPEAGIVEEGLVFRFPYPCHGGSQQHLNYYHQHSYSEHHERLLQLPKSDIDVATATAHWVQYTPLQARSHKDFANLMFAMKSRGRLAENKPCSCPNVCSISQQPLPLLEMPYSWSKSLPVLSSSLSNHILSAYDSVLNKPAISKDIKDLINSKRKRKKHKHDIHDLDDGEYAALIEKGFAAKLQSNRRQSLSGVSYRRDKSRSKRKKVPPKLTIQVPDTKENLPFVNIPNVVRSPVPIPFTPTIMIQNSQSTTKRGQRCNSNTSASSCSSTDLLLASNQGPPIQKPIPGSPKLLSPHLLSPSYDSRKRSQTIFNWSRQDVNRYNDEYRKLSSGSGSPCSITNQQCSFVYPRRESRREQDNHFHSNDEIFRRRHGRCGDNVLMSQARHSELFDHYRSLGDCNYNIDFLSNTSPPGNQNQKRSLSADIPFPVNLHEEEHSPTCSNESNKNFLSYSPTPYLLQVPDSSSLHHTLGPDCGNNANFYLDTRHQPSMRHCVHSDSNIAYHTGMYIPIMPHVDSVRRHSAFNPGEINLSFCDDTTVRPSSSFGSSGSNNSPHHHPQLPHRHHHHPHGGQHSDHHNHHHHHSTSTLGLEDGSSQHIAYVSHPQSYLSRSYSAVVMETKL